MKPNIVLISGTNRTGNRTIGITRHLEKIYRSLGADAQTLDLTNLPPEVFSPDAYSEKPTTLLPWTNAVLGSNGLVIVAPEYNGSFPGALKYFIDLLPFPESFEGRPVCFVGLAAGSWGALRAIEHLQGIFGYRNAHIYPNRVFLPKVHAELETDGSPQKEMNGRLKLQAEGFLDFVGRLHSS